MQHLFQCFNHVSMYCIAIFVLHCIYVTAIRKVTMSAQEMKQVGMIWWLLLEVMMISPGQNYDHWLFLEMLEVLLWLVIPD